MTLYIILCIVSLIIGYIIRPYTFKYLEWVYNYFMGELNTVKEDAEDKINDIKKVIENQIEIGKEKGEDLSQEAKEIWEIITR